MTAARQQARTCAMAGLVCCAGVMGEMLAAPLAAQPAYPNRPVRIIVPFPPGGGADIVARVLAPYLQDAFGQSFYIENRAGAAGRVGTAAVAQAAADGYTLLVTTESSIVIAPHMGVTMPYDPMQDLTPVTLLTRNTVMLAVNPDQPVGKLQDYVALARAHPGQVLYASSGVGGPNHLAGELFKLRTGLDIVHVPFQGSGAALQAVIANQVGSLWAFTSALLPYIATGSLRGIAVGSRRRSPVLLDVPTVIEAGVEDFEAVSWVGLFAPAGLDRRLLLELSSGVRSGLRTRDITQMLERDGSEVAAGSPAEFTRTIQADYAKYARLAGLFKQARP